MPEVILVAALLLGALAVVLRPLRGAAAVDAPPDEAAAVRHRAALEALRDVEADHRAGALDDAAYARELADAEARAAATRAGLDADTAHAPAASDRGGRRTAAVAAAVIGLAIVAGSLVPALGLANATVVDEALAASRAAEAARQDRIRQLTDALADDPADTAVISDLADAYLAGSTADDLARAIAALQLLVAYEPERADAYERAVAAYLRAGDWEDARAALDAYAAIDTADPVELAFLNGLVALRGEGEAAEARDAFDRFLELAPDDPRAPMVRGLREEAAAEVEP